MTIYSSVKAHSGIQSGARHPCGTVINTLLQSPASRRKSLNFPSRNPSFSSCLCKARSEVGSLLARWRLFLSFFFLVSTRTDRSQDSNLPTFAHALCLWPSYHHHHHHRRGDENSTQLSADLQLGWKIWIWFSNRMCIFIDAHLPADAANIHG